MADLIIRGMKMPETCGLCKLCLDDSRICNGYCMFFHRRVNMMERDKNCPLVQLPEGHGRLIDADELLESMRESYQKAQEWRDNSDGEIYDRADATVMAFLEFGNRTKNAPTIVPAEGGTDDATKTD